MPRDVALGYIRLSMGRDDEDSPARQEAAIRDWCRRNGFHNLELYRDVEGRHSGRQDEGRPEWTLFRERMKSPRVAVVVAEMAERFYRNLKLQLNFADECAALGVRFVTVVEGFDFRPRAEPVPLDSSRNVEMEEVMARSSLQTFGSAAELWANLTSAKMKAFVRRKRNSGKYVGTVPFGAQRSAMEILEPDEGGAWYLPPQNGTGPRWAEQSSEGALWRGFHKALLRLYEVYAEDKYGFGYVAELLNQEGWRYKDRRGNPRAFNREDVRRCVYCHPLYAGNLLLGRSRFGGHTVAKEEAWPPLVPLHLIERVVAIVESRGGGPRYVTHKRQIYPLSPILHCAHCKRGMKGQTERTGRRVYRHAPKGDCPADVTQIAASDVEQAALDLLALFNLSDNLAPVIEQAAHEAVAQGKDVADDVARLALLRRRRDRLKTLFVEEEIEIGEYRTKKVQYDRQVEELEDKLGEGGEVAEIGPILARLRELDELAREAGPLQAKNILNTFFDRLEVNLNTGELAYWPAEWARPFF